MIGYIKGKVIVRDDPYIIIDTGGVGYKVLASNSVFSALQSAAEVEVFIYTHVREDAFDLFGFSSYADLHLFELLISVSGIGPKTAIGVFAVGTREQIIHAIVSSDVSFFTHIPRLGSKNAQKIIIELKNKIGSTSDVTLSPHSDSVNEEVVAALKSFGFTTKESHEAAREVEAKAETISEKIRLALKSLGK